MKALRWLLGNVFCRLIGHRDVRIRNFWGSHAECGRCGTWLSVNDPNWRDV